LGFFKYIFLVCPICLTVFLSFQLLNEPGLGVGINPGMALTTLPSSIGRDSKPRPSNRESSLLTTRPDFRPKFLGVRAFRYKTEVLDRFYNSSTPHESALGLSSLLAQMSLRYSQLITWKYWAKRWESTRKWAKIW